MITALNFNKPLSTLDVKTPVSVNLGRSRTSRKPGIVTKFPLSSFFLRFAIIGLF